MKKFLMVVVMAGAFGQIQAAPKAKLAPQSNDQLIAVAQSQLNNYCPGLARYSRDLSTEPATVSEAFDYQRQQWKWSRYVEFNFRVANDPALIPNAYRAAGNRCYFRIGVDGVFALDTPKEECKRVCLDR